MKEQQQDPAVNGVFSRSRKMEDEVDCNNCRQRARSTRRFLAQRSSRRLCCVSFMGWGGMGGNGVWCYQRYTLCRSRVLAAEIERDRQKNFDFTTLPCRCDYHLCCNRLHWSSASSCTLSPEAILGMFRALKASRLRALRGCPRTTLALATNHSLSYGNRFNSPRTAFPAQPPARYL